MNTDQNDGRIPQAHRGPYTLSGVASLGLAVVSLGWVISSVIAYKKDYLLSLIDQAHFLGAGFVIGAEQSHIVNLVACGTAGVLALRGRRVARGALIMISAIVLYQTLNDLIGLQETRFRGFLTSTVKGDLLILSWGVQLLVSILILIALARVDSVRRGTSSPPPGGGWPQPPTAPFAQPGAAFHPQPGQPFPQQPPSFGQPNFPHQPPGPSGY